MIDKDRYLVVVSVLEGRKFPKRPRHKLIAEARFDGELLATDPVDHVENMDFTQELAWELDKKGLHQHRLQRASIKVQMYSVDIQSTMREPVGYVVLDLRSAQSKQTSKWLPLLHCKYNKVKPEIKLGIYIDEDKGAGPETSFKAREAPPRPGQVPSDTSSESVFDPKTLKPTLNETDGYYQIGPEAKCSEQFVLSVTVAFATNLPQLIPASVPLPPTANGYFFYYSLLGNDVTNESFYDLLSPTFPAERASVRLKSSVEALRVFFANQPGLEIHLCCGDQSLGCGEIPLSSLIQKGSTEIYMKPVNIEGAFQLHPPTRMKEQLPPMPEDMKSVVGVSISLRTEDQAMSTAVTPVKESTIHRPEKQTLVTPPAKVVREEEHIQKPHAKHSPPEKKKTSKPTKKVSPPRAESPPAPPTHDGSYTDTFASSDHTDDNVASLKEDVDNKTKKKGVVGSADVENPDFLVKLTEDAGRPLGSNVAPELPVMTLDPRPAAGVIPSNVRVGHPVPITGQTHHFCCSIDLRSIRNMNVPHHANVFVKYTYPFFGSAAPILTHPPVEVRKGMDVLLPQSFCAFDFATSVQQLQDTLTRVPLMVEVWDRDKHKAQNVLLGTAQLPMSYVLTLERARAVHSTGVSGFRQMWDGIVPVVSSEGEPQRVGELHLMLSIEDWGPLQTQQPTAGQESSSVATVSDSTPVPPPPTEPRETLEYKAALELEMWKEGQEQIFETQLKDKELTYMRALSEEWKKRDKEREVLVKKKMVEYQQLEEQLRRTIGDLDKRDKQLAANEQEVMRLRADLQREHERKITEMREASRRMKDDCDHQVLMERGRVKEMEDYIVRLKNQLAEAEAKNQNKEREFTVYKEQQNTKPEVRLQSEINLLTLEKVELERKLDSVTKSKVHYKQQWGRALKELARLKQKEQAVARAQLHKQQQELEHMRLRYLAAEEKEVVKSKKKKVPTATLR